MMVLESRDRAAAERLLGASELEQTQPPPPPLEPSASPVLPKVAAQVGLEEQGLGPVLALLGATSTQQQGPVPGLLSSSSVDSGCESDKESGPLHTVPPTPARRQLSHSRFRSSIGDHLGRRTRAPWGKYDVPLGGQLAI